MSLDIDIWAERKTEAGWEACHGPTSGPRRPRLIYFYPHAERNRQLFAILGGTWWDGCETSGCQFYPIRLPRGLPDDSLYLNGMPPESAVRKSRVARLFASPAVSDLQGNFFQPPGKWVLCGAATSQGEIHHEYPSGVRIVPGAVACRWHRELQGKA